MASFIQQPRVGSKGGAIGSTHSCDLSKRSTGGKLLVSGFGSFLPNAPDGTNPPCDEAAAKLANSEAPVSRDVTLSNSCLTSTVLSKRPTRARGRKDMIGVRWPCS